MEVPKRVRRRGSANIYCEKNREGHLSEGEEEAGKVPSRGAVQGRSAWKGDCGYPKVNGLHTSLTGGRAQKKDVAIG